MIPVWVLLLVLLPVSFPIADASTSSLKPKAVCSGHRVRIPTNSTTGGIWLPLNHRHGPCSPSSPSSDLKSRRRPSTANVLRRHHLRADGSNTTTVTVPTLLDDSFEYMVTIGLGTPAATQTVFIDTGSDITWVQCRPCPVPPCHAQKDAMFDPARSATYSPFSCRSATCRKELVGPGLTHGCSSGRKSPSLCQYVVIYADGSNTTGTYGSDELTFFSPSSSPAPAASSSTVVHGFRFGCSHVVSDQFSEMQVAGILGLGGGAPSLVTQTAERAFSYCLPPTEAHSGFLTLGVPHRRASRFAVTPMHGIAAGGKTYYGVLLKGITVAGRRLRGIPSSVFAAGAAVDSGTVVTQLPRTAYHALRAAFRKEMRRMYNYYPKADPENNFDTCYNLTAGEEKVPSVALVFDGGATVELDTSGVVYEGCLAFSSTGDDTTFGIIGNVQQKTLEVLYDIAGQAVGFRRGAC